MRKDIGKQLAVFPMPVLMVAAYDADGKVNVMNAAWGMIGAMDKVVLFIDEDHKTTQNILETKAFTVSIADEEHMKEADFFGIATGNKMPDKFERTGMHAVKSAHVNAPVIEEFPVAMECRLDSVIEQGNIYAVVGEIVSCSADEKVLGDKDRIDPEKVHALIFDQFRAGYYRVGDKAGQAWKEGKALMPQE